MAEVAPAPKSPISKKVEKNASINLNCYTIRFRKKGDTETFYSFQEAVNQADFKSFMQSFIKTIDISFFLNATKDRIVTLEKIISITDKTISGVIKKGHSGHETYIQEQEGKKVKAVGTVRADQFNSTPFYFLLSLPEPKSDYIVFLAQSYKQFGFKEVFEEAFKKYFDSRGFDFISVFSPLSIARLFKQYVSDGSIRKLRLRKHGLPKSLEAAVREKNVIPQDFEVEMSIKAKRKNNNFLGFLADIDLKNTSFVELFPIDNFEYDEAIVDVSVGNRKRTLNFSDPAGFAASFEMSDKIPINKITKHPDFDKLDTEAKEILKTEIIPFINK